MATQTEGTTEKKGTLQGPNLAELLQKARNTSGMSQTQVAAKLKDMGEDAGPASVSRAENEGPRHMTKAKREALARGYELHFLLVPVGATGEVAEDDTEAVIARLEATTRAAVAKLREHQQQQEKVAGARERDARPARRTRPAPAGGHPNA